MTAHGGATLYTPQILALAVELAGRPLSADLPLHGEARSRVCGSRVTVGIDRNAEGRIARIGARVSACAIGQAAAALFLGAATGRSAGEIAMSLAELEGWLLGAGEMPAWPRIAQLESAIVHPGRHAAILLPWKAALAALSNPARAD